MMQETRLSLIVTMLLAVTGCNETTRRVVLTEAFDEAAQAESVSREVVSASMAGVLVAAAAGKIAKSDETKKPVVKVTSTVNAVSKKETEETTSASTAAENTMEAELLETDGIALEELTIAEGIEERKPVRSGTAFELGEFERLYAFIRVSNPEKTAESITVSWASLDDGRERGEVAVSIGEQDRWRTWAFTSLVRKAGKWQVIVRNSAGEVIGRAPFEVIVK